MGFIDVGHSWYLMLLVRMRSQISTVLQTLSSETGKQLMDDKDFYFANGLPECCLAIASLVLLCHIITMLQITNEEINQLEKLDAAKAAYL